MAGLGEANGVATGAEVTGCLPRNNLLISTHGLCVTFCI